MRWTVLSFLTTFPSIAQGAQQLHGYILKAIETSPMVGEVPDNQTFHLAIGLPLRNQAELQTLIQNLSNPKSPLYHKYLTPQQFAQQFGPTPADYQKLTSFMQSEGLAVIKTTPNRLLLDVQASAADVRRIFHVNLHYYKRPDGTEFYAPDSEPSLDLDLPLAHVSGLNNYSVPHSNFILKGSATTFAQPTSNGLSKSPNSGTGPGGTYWGFDFRNIYVPCTSQTGSGQNIALFELDTYNATNITDYENDTGIGSPSLTKVSVGTAIKRPGSGEIEVELDIEMAMSMAPGSSIYVYENSGSTNADLDDLLNAIANPTSPNPLCDEISSSWTWTGTYDSNVSSIFKQYQAQGQSFFQAAGDLGAYVTDDPQQTVPFPAAETGLITTVGGTSLTTSGSGGTLGSYESETTWNDSPGPSATKTPAPNAVSSGGVCDNSTPIPIPTYQEPFVNAQNGGSANYRNIPDIALIADNVGIYTTSGRKSGLYSVGGTSVAAPLWAALTALINEQAASESAGPVGFINPILYQLAENATTYSNDFNDIADGSTNNYWGTDPSLYESTTGYDLTTGLGSPKCNLISDVVGSLVVSSNSPTPTANLTNTATNTPTNSPTNTSTRTPTNTPTNSPTDTPTNSPTQTATSTHTNTPINTSTNTATNSPTDTSTNSPTATATSTYTYTPVNTPTNTSTNTPINSPTDTSTNSPTQTVTSTYTNTPINTPTNTSTNTATNSPTDTSTSTPTQTTTSTTTNTTTPTMTNTMNAIPSNTPTSTITSTPSTLLNALTPTPISTLTPTPSLSGTGKIILAPVPIPRGGNLCLYANKPLLKSQWDVFDMTGEFILNMNFEGDNQDCWTTTGIPPGIYLVRLKLTYVDGTSATTWQKVLITR